MLHTYWHNFLNIWLWETYCPPPQQSNATAHTDNNSMHFYVYWLFTSSNIFNAIRNHINIAKQSFNYKIYHYSTAYHSECSISVHLLCREFLSNMLSLTMSFRQKTAWDHKFAQYAAHNDTICALMVLLIIKFYVLFPSVFDDTVNNMHRIVASAFNKSDNAQFLLTQDAEG